MSVFTPDDSVETLGLVDYAKKLLEETKDLRNKLNERNTENSALKEDLAAAIEELQNNVTTELDTVVDTVNDQAIEQRAESDAVVTQVKKLTNRVENTQDRTIANETLDSLISQARDKQRPKLEKPRLSFTEAKRLASLKAEAE